MRQIRRKNKSDTYATRNSEKTVRLVRALLVREGIFITKFLSTPGLQAELRRVRQPGKDLACLSCILRGEDDPWVLDLGDNLWADIFVWEFKYIILFHFLVPSILTTHNIPSKTANNQHLKNVSDLIRENAPKEWPEKKQKP